MSDTVETPLAALHVWICLAAIALLCLLCSLDLAALREAMPHPGAGLRLAATHLLRIDLTLLRCPMLALRLAGSFACSGGRI